MRTAVRHRVVQLEPREFKIPVIACRVQQELRDVTLGAWIDGSSTNAGITRVAQRNCSDRVERFWPLIPSILVLVDRGLE